MTETDVMLVDNLILVSGLFVDCKTVTSVIYFFSMKRLYPSLEVEYVFLFSIA